jgi:hypothetical protein
VRAEMGHNRARHHIPYHDCAHYVPVPARARVLPGRLPATPPFLS